MTQTRVECAEARLHKVESELRLIKRLLFVGASSFLIAALAGAGLLSRVPQHVEASEGFVLRDRQGDSWGQTEFQFKLELGLTPRTV